MNKSRTYVPYYALPNDSLQLDKIFSTLFVFQLYRICIHDSVQCECHGSSSSGGGDGVGGNGVAGGGVSISRGSYQKIEYDNSNK